MKKLISSGAFIVLVTALVAAPETRAQAATRNQSFYDVLPDVVAKVDGQEILKTDALSAAQDSGFDRIQTQSFKPQVDAYIDRHLVVEAALAEKLDETPEYEKGLEVLKVQITLAESRTLSTYYRRQTPEFGTAVQIRSITDKEADAYVRANPANFKDKFRAEALYLAKNLIIRERNATAQYDWMTAHLPKATIKVNGETVPSEMIEEAIEAADSRIWKPSSILLPIVVKSAIAREAEATGEGQAVIKQDEDRVRKLVAASELEVDDMKITLQDVLGFTGLLQHLSGSGATSNRPLILKLVTNLVMADVARKENLDKDEVYVEQLALQAEQMRIRGRTRLLTKLYRGKHLDPEAATWDDWKALVATLRETAEIEYMID